MRIKVILHLFSNPTILSCIMQCWKKIIHAIWKLNCIYLDFQHPQNLRLSFSKVRWRILTQHLTSHVLIVRIVKIVSTKRERNLRHTSWQFGLQNVYRVVKIRENMSLTRSRSSDKIIFYQISAWPQSHSIFTRLNRQFLRDEWIKGWLRGSKIILHFKFYLTQPVEYIDYIISI